MLLASLAALALPTPSLPTPAPPQDWPRFMGPHGTAEVSGAGLSFDWGEEGPPVLWETELGSGFGGPAVRDGRVFLLDRLDESDVLRVFDLASGEELWEAGYEAPGRLNYPGSRTVPVVTDTHVYTCGGFGHATAFDRAKEELAWQIDMAEDYGGRLPGFGWSGNPLQLGQTLVFTVLGEEVGLLAVDGATGEEVWVTETVGYSHSTPVLLEVLGEPQVLFLSTPDQATGNDERAPMWISSFDPADGALLWREELEMCRLPIPAPVLVDREHLFLTGGYRAGSRLVKVARDGNDWSLEELFDSTRGAQTHAPILHGGFLYAIVNENWNDFTRGRRKEGGLVCFDLEGNERWRTGEEPFFGRGNLLLAGEHFLILDGHSGVLRAVKATPDRYEPVAEANLFGIDDRRDHQMWAPMALAGTKLLLRSQEKLLCVDLSGQRG